MSKQFKNAKALLEYLNETHVKLHKEYEDLFWVSNMYDHSIDGKMNDAQAARDAFRSNAELCQEVKSFLKTAKGSVKDRLKIWDHFFGVYQVPPEALAIRKQIGDVESKIAIARSTRKEGYIDPKSGSFVEASENQMRTLMATNPDEAVRKACFEAMQKLPYDSIDDYIEVIKLRNRYANALGFADFYEYKARIDENMSKKELFSIFESLYEKTKHAFEGVRAMEKDRPGLRKPWNYSFMLSGNFIVEEDQYFRFENVLSYWGTSFAALGIGFKGGHVKLDLLDRQGKHNNGFCHYPDLVYYKNGKRISGGSNFTSNAVPGQVGSGVQGINTVFHEGGHAADRLNSMQGESCINTEYPPSSVSWAETHSMFMDAISDSIEWRVRYAKNDKGEAYPFGLFERRLRALFALRPLALMGVCMVVDFERRIYEEKHLTQDAVLTIAREIYKKYVDHSEESIAILNIPHIYSFESSAYYHGYGLAELGVFQWRDYFYKKHGYIVDNPKVGKEITKIWSYASLYPGKKLIAMATGKKLSPNAFIKEVNMPIEKILSRAKEKIKRLEKVPRYAKPVDLDGSIMMVHGTEKIADNSKSFEDMDRKYRAWLKKKADR
jgi:hypothetical protein